MDFWLWTTHAEAKFSGSQGVPSGNRIRDARANHADWILACFPDAGGYVVTRGDYAPSGEGGETESEGGQSDGGVADGSDAE
jgi:hypothetical protein